LLAELAGWRLLRLLGRGSHGSVYAGQSAADSTTVALKVVSLPTGAQAAAAAQVFLDTAGVAQRLQHPGIVAALDAGIDGAHAWLAMELVPGHDLSRHTSPGQLLPLGQVLTVAEQLAQALAYAHRHGVVHRDLKPANVLVDWSTGAVKLADFGLARAADALQTGTGLVPGSPAYMAPEQLAGGVPSAQTDFYALGVVLFQLLTGRLPHESHSMGELLRQVAQEPAPDLQLLRPDLPTEVATLLARLLAKRPEQRPADGDVLAADLRSIRHAFAAHR
jgi:serine/threonine protein kinase